MSDTVDVMYAPTGEVSRGVRRKWLASLSKDYVVVEPGTKPYVKKTYKPRTPAEFEQTRNRRGSEKKNRSEP